MRELITALAALVEPPSAQTERLAELLQLGTPPTAEEHAEVFLFQLYPYASVYLGAEGMIGGEARDRIAGFWRALELDPPPEPDHLATLAAFYAELVSEEDAQEDERSHAAAERARRALLDEHLLSWLPVYLAKLEHLTAGFYRRWAGLLAAALEKERRRDPAPALLPLQLREAPLLEAPADAGGEAFLKALLAPARTGLLLVRSDIARAGRDLGLALRAGERRFALRALLAQDASGTLDWLSREAGAQAARHRATAMPPAIAEFWSGRALATKALLAAARDDL